MAKNANVPELLQICRRVAKLCGDAFPKLELPPEDPSARPRAALCARALEHFHGIVRLSEAGLAAPARVVVRSLLEVSFFEAALANGKLTAGELFAQHDHWRLRLSNKAQNQFSPEIRRGLVGVTRDDQSQLRKRIEESGVPALSIAEVARRAGREDECWLIFEHFSATVHVTTRDVSKHFVDGSDGELRLVVGSQPPDPDTLQVAAMTMLQMAVDLAELVEADIVDDAARLMTALAAAGRSEITK